MSSTATLLHLPSDMFATMTSFLNTREVTLLRLVSHQTKQLVDRNEVWCHRLVLTHGITHTGPVLTPKSWRDFARRHALHHLPRAFGPKLGCWKVLASAAEGRSRNVVREETVRELVEVLRPPQPLHLAIPTVSVGMLICGSTAALTAMWPLIDPQIRQFLDLAPPTRDGKPQLQFPSIALDADTPQQQQQAVPSDASLFLMNAFPYFPNRDPHHHGQPRGSYRLVFCAVDTGLPAQRRAVAEHFATLMHTCALVHVIGSSEADLISLAEGISPMLPTVEASAFSTNQNTPTLVFNTHNGKQEVDLAHVLQRCPHSFQTWVLNRTCSVGTSILTHQNLFSVSRTPYAVPSFSAPGVAAVIGPSTIVRMASLFLADQVAEFPRSRVLWEDATLRHAVKGHVEYHAAFYKRAMMTDFGEHTRASHAPHLGVVESHCQALCVYEQHRLLSAHVLNPSQDANTPLPPEEHTQLSPLDALLQNQTENAQIIAAQFRELLDAFPQQCTPMDPHDMVEIHNGHCYSTLRRFAFELPTVAGSDIEKGLRQLETLKREVAGEFRNFWRQNNELSRRFCNTLFLFVVAAPLFAKFFTDRFAASSLAKVDKVVGEGDAAARYGIQEKRGLKHFFSAAKDVIEEYVLKSRGLRKFDVLSERLADSLVPAVLTFCTLHPHRHTPMDAVLAACEELQAEVVKGNAAYSQSVDGRLNEAQGESALYTASLSSEWAAEAERAAIERMKQLQDEVEAWESACLARIRILLSHRVADDASSSAAGDGEGSSSNRPTTEGRSNSSAMLRSESMPQQWMHPTGEGLSEDDGWEMAPSPASPEELEEAEDARRRMEYEEARRQVLQQAMVNEANFRSQSVRLNSRMASTSQHSKNFSIVRSSGASSGPSQDGRLGTFSLRVKESLRKFFS